MFVTALRSRQEDKVPTRQSLFVNMMAQRMGRTRRLRIARPLPRSKTVARSCQTATTSQRPAIPTRLRSWTMNEITEV